MFTELTTTKISDSAIMEALEIAEKATNEDLDNAITTIGREIIQGYIRGIVSESQRNRLDEYRKYRENIDMEIREENISKRLFYIEQNDEKPMIFQIGAIDGRIVVASTKTEIREKKEVEVANGGGNCIIEIYRDRTPLAYEYARKNYQVYEKR